MLNGHTDEAIFTCRIVSKLKVRPFHKVNSPLDAPVTRRRPSGVQSTQKMGQRILLVEVRTNLVVIQFTEFSRVAIGGVSYVQHNRVLVAKQLPAGFHLSQQTSV